MKRHFHCFFFGSISDVTLSFNWKIDCRLQQFDRMRYYTNVPLLDHAHRRRRWKVSKTDMEHGNDFRLLSLTRMSACLAKREKIIFWAKRKRISEHGNWIGVRATPPLTICRRNTRASQRTCCRFFKIIYIYTGGEAIGYACQKSGWTLCSRPTSRS